MKPFGHKLPFLIGFFVILILVTQTNFNFTSVTAVVEANQTNSNVTVNNPIQHVIVIIMENKGYTQIIGSSDAPYQNELAKKYASVSKY